ncbi:unnamed protein product [Polarella glacialis]|uniref:Uncharacterized protein n=1 Tax=Polarella glacialis TaxID=89957 RepID=A0A813GBJ5_POLGL|nr:unnamed protein product [Polarella glacialis]
MHREALIFLCGADLCGRDRFIGARGIASRSEGLRRCTWEMDHRQYYSQSVKQVKNFWGDDSDPSINVEDVFLDRCLQRLNAWPLVENRLLYDPQFGSYPPEDCALGFVAYHPFKDVLGHQTCLLHATARARNVSSDQPFHEELHLLVMRHKGPSTMSQKQRLLKSPFVHLTEGKIMLAHAIAGMILRWLLSQDSLLAQSWPSSSSATVDCKAPSHKDQNAGTPACSTGCDLEVLESHLERGQKVLEYHWNEVWISAFDALRADFHQFQNGQMLECESQLYDMWPSCLREWVGSARMSSYPCLEIISDVLLSIRVLNQSLSYELHARLTEPVHALPGSQCSACLQASLTPWTVFGQWPAVYYPVRPLQGCDAGLCDSASMAADHPSIGLLLAEVMGALPAVRDALLALALQESEDLVGFNKNAAHNWLTKPIFKSARGWVAESCKHFPTLCTSLRKHLPSVPHPVTHWDAEDASINCLLPGGHVPPHADDYKGNLYVQTMVNLFGTSLFRFGGRATRLSGFGSSLTFDPSFMHEVENDGEHVRCLLSVRRARPLYHGSFRLVKVLPPGQLGEKCPSAVDLLQILRYSLRNARLVEAALADGIISAVLQVMSEVLPLANAILHEPGGDRYLDTLLTMFKEALKSVETRFMSLSGAALRFTLLHTEQQDTRLLPNRRVVEQKLVLSNGVAIPQSGFGTEHLGGKWARTHNTDAYSLVLEALSVGYRMIDTAQAYENEAEVGLAIRHSGIPREDIAISTKLNTWQDQRWSEELVRDIFSQVMEDLYRQGKIRALGVSNFGLDDLDALLSFARVRPVYLQSPFMLYDCGHEDACINSRFLSALEDFGITFVSFSSANEEVTPLPVLSDPHVCSLASRSSVSPAVLLRRWVLDHGVGVLARSKSKEHMLENLAAQALPALSAEAFALLNAVGALYSQTDFEFTAMESSSHQGAAILALPGIAIQADWQEEYSGLEQADNATCFPDALDATQPRASTSVVLGFHNLHCDIHFAIDQSGWTRRMHDMLLKSFEEIVAEASAFGNLKETTFLHTASDGFSRPNCARFVQTCMALRRISAALLEDLPARLDLKSTLQDASLLRLRAGSRLVTGGSTLPGTQSSGQALAS